MQSQSLRVETGHDPQYGLYRANDENLLTIRKALTYELEGQNPWWGLQPMYTELTPANVACCFGRRLCYAHEPVQCALRWAALLIPEVPELCADALWQHFAEVAEHSAAVWVAEEFVKQTHPLRSAFQAFRKQHIPDSATHARLWRLYRALCTYRETRSFVFPLVETLTGDALAWADALFRRILADQYSTTLAPLLSEGHLGSSAPRTPRKLGNAAMNHSILAYAELPQTRFCNASLRGADFRGASLSYGDFTESWLLRADLRGATLRYARLTLANLEHATLETADLFGASLNDARMCNAVLNKTILQNAMLTDANLYGAQLNGADLRDATAYNVVLHNAVLRDADLSRANLKGANLRGADLRGATLKNANLLGANLCGADLCGADLRRTDLSGANLSGANLTDALTDGAARNGSSLLSL